MMQRRDERQAGRSLDIARQVEEIADRLARRRRSGRLRGRRAAPDPARRPRSCADGPTLARSAGHGRMRMPNGSKIIREGTDSTTVVIGGRRPTQDAGRLTPLLAVALVVIAAIVGAFTWRHGPRTTEPPRHQAAATPPPVPDAPPPMAKLGPHTQDESAAAAFQIRRPRVRPTSCAPRTASRRSIPKCSSYVPCYCGCERSGHRGNEDCFVSSARRERRRDGVGTARHD